MASARAITAELNRVGITAVLDVGGGGRYKSGYKVFKKLRNENNLTVRTFYTMFQPKAKKLLKKLKENSPPSGTDTFYRLIGIGETFYRPLHDNTFRKFKTSGKHAAKLLELARAAAGTEWHIHMHATLDETGSHVLDNFERANRATPLKPLRWVFAHMDAVGPKNIARMKKLGMMAAIHSHPTIQGRM